METRKLRTKLDDKPRTSFSESKPPSGSTADREFFVSYGAIISCKLGDVDRIRSSIAREGGRIVFQTVSNGPLFLLRAAQVEKALAGDVSALAEIHIKKARRLEKNE